MASINQLEKLHKDIFNNLTEEELDVYLKKASEERFKHINFISENGTITSDMAKYFDLDKIEADLFLNISSTNKKIAVGGTALSYDYINLSKKYDKQFKTALMLYHNSIFKDIRLINNLISQMEGLLEVFRKEPSGVLYNLLQDVATSTEGTFTNAKTNIDSYFTNISVLSKGIEEFIQLKELIERRYSIYFDLVEEIKQLDKPEGAVN